MIVKGNLSFPDKSSIAHEILSYLAEHPEAKDTLEGIVHWWLLEQKIKHQTAIVKEAIAELVAKGFILEHTTADSQIHYRINRHKHEEILKFTKQDQG